MKNTNVERTYDIYIKQHVCVREKKLAKPKFLMVSLILSLVFVTLVHFESESTLKKPRTQAEPWAMWQSL